MKTKILVSLVLVLVFLASALAGCAPSVNGDMPKYAVGDTWVSRWITEGSTYTVTTIVTGEQVVNGKNCWIFTTTFDPAYQNVVSVTNQYDKSNMDIVRSDYKTDKPDGSFTSIGYEVVGKPFYPLKVGKVVTETDYMETVYGNKSLATSENTTQITATLVEKTETVTVAAGTFHCFKVIKYDDSGNVTGTTWRSDKTKLFQVKATDASSPNDTYELVSYSLK